jgi:hypothetical protein
LLTEKDAYLEQSFGLCFIVVGTSLSMRPILYLLPFCLAAIAAPAPANSGDENDDQNCEEWDGDMIENKDAPTADGSPGIGIEFESPMFYFSSPSCPEATVNNAKKKVLAGRKQKVDSGKSPLWMLTADTGAGERVLQAEYIIDGQQIKLGSGQAETVTKEIVKDFVRIALIWLSHLVANIETFSDRLATLEKTDRKRPSEDRSRRHPVRLLH